MGRAQGQRIIGHAVCGPVRSLVETPPVHGWSESLGFAEWVCVMSAADELQRLEREIDAAERQRRQPPGNAEQLKPAEKQPQPERQRSRSFDIALAACALLVAASVGIYWVRRMEPQNATALQNGLTGAAAGMVAGYAVGRLRR